jgi:glutaredoxin 3
MSASVTVYSTTYCPYCTRAKALLSKKGAAFDEVDVTERADLRAWLIEATGQRTVPQIFVNGAPVGGFSDLAALEQAGSLDGMLARPPAAGDAAVRR